MSRRGDEFDQSERGVRKLAKSDNLKAAGDTITNYISANNEKLTPSQRFLLWFHADQNARLLNKNDEAIIFFEKASGDKTIPKSFLLKE